jgi:hypothetical protein
MLAGQINQRPRIVLHLRCGPLPVAENGVAPLEGIALVQLCGSDCNKSPQQRRMGYLE